MTDGEREDELLKTHRKGQIRPPASRRRALRVVASPDAAAVGRTFELDGSAWVLGRTVLGPGMIADRAMSREHVRLQPEAAGDDPSPRYSVVDLGGANGTYVDGQLATDPVPLGSNTVVSVGDTLLVVDVDPERDRLVAAPHADGSVVEEWVGISFGAQRVRQAIVTAAPSRAPVLLLGPTGSGKEVAARAIHRLSGRTGPWVPVNCAAIPAEIAEAEFFGYKRGAFTGAIADRDGFFVQASGGTLFLDEIGDLPVPLQAKLLRVLEDGYVQSLGGGAPRKVDLRVVAGTHLDLDRISFRRDLLARLGDWVLHLPSLAERRADVLVLWEHFVRRESEGLSSWGPEDLGELRPIRASTPEFAEALLLHDWPMNVRELLKLARRLFTLAAGSPVFDLVHLPDVMQRRIAQRRGAEHASTAVRTTPAAMPLDALAGPQVVSFTPNTPAPGPTAVTLPPGAALVGAGLGGSGLEVPPGSGAPSATPGATPVASRAPAFPPDAPLGADANAPNRIVLEQALAKARGNVSLVAEQNGWHRTQVYRWIKRAGLDPDQFR